MPIGTAQYAASGTMKEFDPLPYQYDELDLIACAKDHPTLG